MKQEKEILIVGAGFSGLVQAYYLVQEGFKVILCDIEKRTGGVIQTQKEQDYLFESAANAFLANRELETLSQEIGVSLMPTLSGAKIRWIFRFSEMKRWPLSYKESLPVISFLLTTLLWHRWLGLRSLGIKNKETLKEWADRRLGKAGSEYLLEPAMQGVFATTSDKLDAQLILSSLFNRRPRGKLRGSVAPRDGMGEWVTQLKNYLIQKGCEFRLGLSQQEVNQLIDSKLKSPQKNKALVLAVDLNSLKQLANDKIILLPESLERTSSTSLTSVKLIYKNQPPVVRGFGCLFPRSERFYSLGVLFNHNIFAHRAPHGVSETWILNDQKMKMSEMSEQALIRYVQSDRYQLFSKHQEPDNVRVDQWQNRIPVYDQNLALFLEDLKNKRPSFALIGNYLGDLGLSKILFHAKKNAKSFVEEWSE